MKLIKKILFALFFAAVVTVVGFVIWAENPLPAAPEALAALQSDAQVKVTVSNDFTIFEPVDGKPVMGFIFYPGGRVDYRAYAAPLREIAAQGYFVALLPVRLNLAFFDVNAAAPVFTARPEIQHWVTGGHSLGGVASALYAQDHLDQIEGIIFWASYPADESIRDSDLKVLSIYGTRDMAGMEKFEETKPLMPVNTQYVVIDGANHAQFGDYGFQPGDYKATISRAEQQAQVVDAVVKFLQDLSE